MATASRFAKAINRNEVRRPRQRTPVPAQSMQSVTAAGAIFVIVVSVRHELFLFVEGPLVGPDEREIDEAHDLFPPKGP